MHYFRLKQAARRFITGAVLLAVVITAFVPNWTSATQASADAVSTDFAAAANTAPTADLSGPAARPVETGQAASITNTITPLNTLILSESGTAASLETAIVEAGGSVYMRQGDMLFAGVTGLDDAALSDLGARATYRDTVSDGELAALTAIEQQTAVIWNSLIHREPVDASEFLANGSDARSRVFVSSDDPTSGGPRAAYEPTETQTSSFLYGDVAVKVLFVESTSGSENWQETEVNKVKTEVSQALDWWANVSSAPTPGGGANPLAHVTWDISYVSPFDGDPGEQANIMIPVEPIESTVVDAADPATGWMQAVANSFNGLSGNPALRKLADDARTAADTDWGMVLFVVDSSADADGRFADERVSGAALGGPWALVTYDGGDLGVDSLEVLIAKMVGHVFGAGDEGWTPEYGGCRPEEVYGYLRVEHENCEYDLNIDNVVPSMMRSGNAMISGYNNYQLSASARGQVGWRDADEDGVYDVVDTMQNGFTGFPSDPVCPTLHFGDVPIDNSPALPDGITDPVGASWEVEVWDPEHDEPGREDVGGLELITLYEPVNINYPMAVWGRANNGPWQVGDATDGAWDGETDETYTLTVNGWAGATNNVELIVLDRWENNILTDPVAVDVKVPPSSGTYQAENRSTPRVDLFDHEGNYESGWSPVGFSGGTYMNSGAEPGHEACFTFDGRMARIQYVTDSTAVSNKAQVFVDGELHSTIIYNGPDDTAMQHLIANLPDAYHTVQVVAETGPINIDNFNIWAITPADVIHGTYVGGATSYTPDVNAGGLFFYENTPSKYWRVGSWTTEPLPASTRPGAPPSNTSWTSLQPYDRMYMFVDQANVVAIYREVGPGAGTANVYVDGEFRGVMDNEADFTDVLPFYIGGLEPDREAPDPWYHAIELRVNPDSAGVDLDALRVLYLPDGSIDMMTAPLGGTSDILYNDPMVQQEAYGAWTEQNLTKLVQARDTGSMLNIFFQGSAVAALVRTNPLTGGQFEMYVDGKLVRTVNLRTAFSNDAPIIAHGFDETLPHVLQIRHTNANPNFKRYSQYRGFRVYNIEPVTPADCGMSSGPDKGGCEEYNYDGNGDPTTSVFLYEQLWRFVKVNFGALPSEQRFVESRHRESRAYLYVTDTDTVALYGVSGLIYGKVEVLVDGNLVGTWDLKRGVRGVDHPYTITGLTPSKKHVIELRMQNSIGRMGLDRVVLYDRPALVPNSTLPGGNPNANGYENDALVNGVPALQFSGQWRRIADTRASGESYEIAAKAGDKVEFDVDGASAVVVYRRMQTAYGPVNVFVNDEFYGSFDNKLFSYAGVFQQPFTIAGLNPDFKNRIRIEGQIVTNYRGISTAKPYDIDYVYVRAPGEEAAGSTYLEPGFYDDNDAQALAGGAITYIGDKWTIVDDNHRAVGTGQKAQLIFEGNALTVYIDKAGFGGKVELYVDGVLMNKMSQAGTTPDVPLTAVGLADGVHVGELVVVAGAVLLDSFQVYDLSVDAAPTYDLTDPGDQATFDTPGYLLSEEWTVSASGYLETNELDAHLYAYLTGGDTVFLTHASGGASATIEIYVNGELYATLDPTYIRQQPAPESQYMLGGLMSMQDEGTWVEIRKKGFGKIGLKALSVGNLADLGTLATGVPVEAEAFETEPGLYLIGTWQKQPFAANPNYSGGFHMLSGNLNAKALIAVEGVSYVTIYRTMLFNYNDAAVYVDGEFWGNMPNRSYVARFQVPFSIGPLDPDTAHAIELRQTNFQRYAIDYIQTVDTLPGPLGAGYYENNDPALAGGYVGNWLEVSDVNASGGTHHRGLGAGSHLSFAFTGNMITFYRQMWPLGIKTLAYIDGTPYAISNRYGQKLNQVPYTIVLPTSGQHTAQLMVNAGATWLDAIEIGNIGPATYGAYQNDDPRVIVNSDPLWNEEVSADHSGGSYLWTNQKDANAFLLFYGESAAIYATRGRTWGKYSVYLDGQFIEEIDLYVNQTPDVPFFKYEITGLPKMNHVLEFRFERHKNFRAFGLPKANFDVITIDGADAPQPGEDVVPGSNIPRAGCFEELDSKWVLSGPGDAWVLVDETPSASGDQYLAGAPYPNVAAEITFKSAGFTLLYHTEGGAGLADIELDGTIVATLDMANVGIDSFEMGGLDPNKLHVLRIKQGGGGDIFIDRLDLPAYNPSYDDNCPIQ